MDNVNTDKDKLSEQMRTLWQIRVKCTRELLVGIAAGHGADVDIILKKLSKNQEDIGNVLKPYLEKYLFCWNNIPGDDTPILTEFLFQSFGINWIKTAEVVVTEKEDNDKTIVVSSHPNSVSISLNDERTRATLVIDIGSKPHAFNFDAKAQNGRLNIYLDNSENKNMLVTLIKNNITMSKNLIKAKEAGDTSMDLNVQEALKDNAVSTAAFLSGLNSNWSHKLLETMLLDNISLLIEGTIAYINKNSEADLAACEKIQKQADKIADALIDGCLNKT